MFAAQEARNISNKAYKERLLCLKSRQQCVRASTVVGFMKLTFHQPRGLTWKN